jgi:hypothetical protein
MGPVSVCMGKARYRVLSKSMVETLREMVNARSVTGVRGGFSNKLEQHSAMGGALLEIDLPDCMIQRGEPLISSGE